MSVGARNARIDMLRGISILLVLLHHFNIAYRLDDTVLARAIGWPALHAIVRNGNYAVTIFFAVSGFLITSNAERRWGRLSRIDILAFYRRRAARILPCVVLLLVIVNALAALGIAIFRNTPEFGGPVSFWIVDLASLTFWMNVLMSHAGWLNYVLCVQWSLSIEEVFYLSFPILCLLLRKDSRLLLAWSLFIVIGPIWRETHQLSEYQELNAYLSCFDGIAFGCGAALLGRRTKRPAWSVTPAQIAIATAMAAFYLWQSIAVTAVYGVTLIALGTALLLILETSAPPPRPTPALAPLRACGRLSLELYLFHLLVLAGLRTLWPPAEITGNWKMLLLVAYLAGSATVALAVSRLYSEPLNQRLRATPSTRPHLHCA